MLVYGQVTTENELHQILALQQQNLPSVLSMEEKVNEGFVTVRHSIEILRRMNRACPHIIAKDAEKVVGYALCMHPMFAEEIAVLKPMFIEIENSLPVSEKYLAMGQICIDKAYRKMGIFRKLYETMALVLKSDYNLILTEVDALNTRSLNAHYAVGFKDIKRYSSGGQDWVVVALNTK